jgi:hypothetical protein
MPPLGTHWDDDDRRSWLHLWIESVNLVYHQSESDMSVTTAPPSPAPSNGSSNGSSSSSSSDGSSSSSDGSSSASPSPLSS